MDKKESLIQFIKFCIVGVSNTLIAYAVYSLCIYLGLHYFIANAIGFIISVTNAFFWSNRYVFKQEEGKKRNLWLTYFKTVSAYATTGLLLSSVLLYLIIDIAGVSSYIAQIFSLAITVPLNFILNKYWSFKDKKSNE